MIKVLFFARIRDELGLDQCHIELPPDVSSLAQLTRHLIATHPAMGGVIDQPSVLAAVNQEFANGQTPVVEGDEIAFFPPVTGG